MRAHLLLVLRRTGHGCTLLVALLGFLLGSLHVQRLPLGVLEAHLLLLLLLILLLLGPSLLLFELPAAGGLLLLLLLLLLGVPPPQLVLPTLLLLKVSLVLLLVLLVLLVLLLLLAPLALLFLLLKSPLALHLLLAPPALFLLKHASAALFCFAEPPLFGVELYASEVLRWLAEAAFFVLRLLQALFLVLALPKLGFANLLLTLVELLVAALPRVLSRIAGWLLLVARLLVSRLLVSWLLVAGLLVAMQRRGRRYVGVVLLNRRRTGSSRAGEGHVVPGRRVRPLWLRRSTAIRWRPRFWRRCWRRSNPLHRSRPVRGSIWVSTNFVFAQSL